MVKDNFVTVMDMIKDLINEYDILIEKHYAKTSPAPTMINPKIFNLMQEDLTNLLASKRQLNHMREVLLMRAGNDSITINEDIDLLEAEREKTNELINVAKQTLNDVIQYTKEILPMSEVTNKDVPDSKETNVNENKLEKVHNTKPGKKSKTNQ